MTPAANLYAYMASAVPPKMERETQLADEERPRGDFRINIRLPRRLETVHQIHPEAISERAQKYPIPAENIPDIPRSSLDNLILPGVNHIRGNPETLTRFGGVARTREDVGDFVDGLILRTATSALNMLAPPAVGIWLTVPREPTPVRGTGSEPLTGEPAIEGGLYTIGRQIADRPFHTPHLAVISFPPWKVTPSDIRDFCKPWRFDPTLVGPNAKDLEGSRLTRKEKMWYYVHDTCLKYHCRWFAITTADYWAFGMFASGWAGAFTSPPLPYFNQQPTVLQVLTLWTMSSLYENQRGNPFIMPIRSLELLTADSIDEDEILEAENYADLDDNDDQDDTRTEIDENDAAEIALAGAYSALNWGPLVTRWGSEIYGEFSSINVLQDQPGPAPADRLAFSQAVQKTSSMQARLARRFSPYPPLAKNQAHSSRVALSPIHETFDGGSGSAVAGPSKKKDEGNGRALDIATPLKAALPTISNALSRSASAPAAVLSLAFRERPGTNVSVRLTSTRTGLINNSLGTSLLGFDNPAEVPCQSRPSSLASKAPLTRENSFREHRPLVPMLPSSPVAGPNLGLSDNDEGATEMAE